MNSITYNQTSKFDELEGIRGIAAILVVIFHIPIWNSIFDIAFIRNSYLMVDLFFVLSGFIICTNYRNINSFNNYLKFVFLRFGRLYPIHIFVVLLYLLLELIRYIAVAELGAEVFTQPFKDGAFLIYIQNIFLLQAIVGTGDGLNVPAWSVSVEFYTYLLFGIIALIVRQEYKKYTYITLSVFFISLLIINIHLLKINDSNAILRCLTGFFIGCVASYSRDKVNYFFVSYFSILGIIFLIIFLLIKPAGEIYDPLIYLISFFLILSLISSPKNFLKNFLCSKYIVFLGTISYSIYMSHYIIIRLFDMALRRLFSFPIRNYNGAVVVELNILHAIFFSTLLILVTIFVSLLLYRFIEAPFREKSRIYALKKMVV